MQPSGLSQHPADHLIRALIATGRSATAFEIEQIVERMATAPFDPRALPVPIPLRGVEYQGRTLGRREPVLLTHLVQRVVGDEQWVVGTTEAAYLDDVRRAAQASSARLVLYARRGGTMAATLTPTARVLPANRLGGKSLPQFFVVYSADRGTIASGYQASSSETLSIPGDARWLK